MYCPSCRVHFSGAGGGGKCPYCGGDAEGSGQRAVAQPEAPAPSREAPEDRTRTEAPPSDVWPPGSVVAGKYEIVSCLGSGGFGTVYKVRHVFRKKYYALKTPHPELSRDQVFRKRFEREIEAMERFVHPDAVMIRDSGVTGDLRPYYTMDFVDGESLRGVLRGEGRLLPERAVAIATRVLKVLDVAHAHQIIHRDIKPDNLLLTHLGGREAVKVLDFGVAKLLDLVGDTGSISRGLRIGTPRYMSPEQITGESVDQRSDLFSLGIVLYEALTGKHPFAEGKDAIRATGAILNREPLNPRDLVGDLPRALCDLVLALLEKKPRRRPESAREVLERLQSLPESSSRLEPIDPLGLVEGVERERARPLVLLQESSQGERRCFLFFQDTLTLGRSQLPEKGIRNDVILRSLPCRSATLDPESWQRNLTISHQALRLSLEGSVVVLDPGSEAKHGIVVGGVRSQRAARIQSDRFHLAVGERALELDGLRAIRGPDAEDLDLGFLRPQFSEAAPQCGYSNRAVRVDRVSLLRANNWPLHEYHLVLRALTLGSSANAGLRLRGAGVEGIHAVVIHEGGESFFLAFEEGIAFFLHREGGAEEHHLPPRRLLPLVPGLVLIIGENRLRVESAEERHFKTA